MTTTCANCRAEVGDAAYCPQCGHAVLSPQSAPPTPSGRPDWRTDTSERPATRAPVEPPPAVVTPGPPRYPLYADDTTDSVEAHVEPDAPPAAPPAEPTSYLDDQDLDDDYERRMVPAWLPWVLVALMLLLVAVGGVWLLLSAGGDDSATEPPAASASASASASQDTSDEPASPSSSAAEQPSSSAPPPSETVPAGDPVDVAASAIATAPAAAPPNEDAFGNRTTYVAANMLDGRADTCWRMAGDGTGVELTFQLAGPTTMTRVGMINGYAKNAVVGGRNLNWYVGNRRVLAAQWVFDDGTTVDQPLGATKQMQAIDLGGPVTTSVVRLRLVAVSSPGTGRSARDYTAVSEVTLIGTPSA
jgi:hypothetical protein